MGPYRQFARPLAVLAALLVAACSTDASAYDRQLAAGDAAIAAGRPAEALAAYERAVALRPEPAALAGSARALEALGRFREAAGRLADARRARPADRALAFHAARLDERAGKTEEAAAAYRALFEATPPDAAAGLRWAEYLVGRQRIGEALAVLERIAGLDAPEHVKTRAARILGALR